jgi:hypothetical protein
VTRLFDRPHSYRDLHFLFFITPPGWTTVLLIGLDRPPEEDSNLTRSDTMIPRHYSALPASADEHALLHPPDLWVNIPLYGESRINDAAHYFGELYNPGYRMESAAETIESKLWNRCPLCHSFEIRTALREL